MCSFFTFPQVVLCNWVYLHECHTWNEFVFSHGFCFSLVSEGMVLKCVWMDKHGWRLSVLQVLISVILTDLYSIKTLQCVCVCWWNICRCTLSVFGVYVCALFLHVCVTAQTVEGLLIAQSVVFSVFAFNVPWSQAQVQHQCLLNCLDVFTINNSKWTLFCMLLSYL